MFTAGSVVTLDDSVVAGPLPAVELAGRVLQGGGAALIAPSALTLSMVLFGDRPKELTKALALSEAAGGTAGVFPGGVITEWLSWPWAQDRPRPMPGITASTSAKSCTAPRRTRSMRHTGLSRSRPTGLADESSFRRNRDYESCFPQELSRVAEGAQCDAEFRCQAPFGRKRCVGREFAGFDTGFELLENRPVEILRSPTVFRHRRLRRTRPQPFSSLSATFTRSGIA